MKERKLINGKVVLNIKRFLDRCFQEDVDLKKVRFDEIYYIDEKQILLKFSKK